MDEHNQELTIRRILVALDASTHSLAALEAAASLAASLGAELIGLFVEDENLVNLAGLPFAQEITTPSAASQPLDSARMEQALQLQASQARRALEEAAMRFQARWRFQVVRGQVTASVLDAALEVDLLAMGRVSRPLSSRSHLGSTARAASMQTRGSVLFMEQGSNLSYPVLVTYDGTPPAGQALATAARMAGASAGILTVLLLGDSVERMSLLGKEVAGRLERQNLQVRTRWLPQASVKNLAALIQAADDCVLVLGGEHLLLEAGAIQELLDTTDCPVLLVR